MYIPICLRKQNHILYNSASFKQSVLLKAKIDFNMCVKLNIFPIVCNRGTEEMNRAGNKWLLSLKDVFLTIAVPVIR